MTHLVSRNNGCRQPVSMFAYHCVFWCRSGSRRWLKIKNIPHYLKNKRRGLCSLGGGMRSLSAFSFTKRLNIRKLHFPQICGLMRLTGFVWPVLSEKNRDKNKRNKYFITCKKKEHFCSMSSDSKQSMCTGRSQLFMVSVSSLCGFYRTVYCWTPLLLPRPSRPSSHTHTKNNSPSIMSCQQHTFT